MSRSKFLSLFRLGVRQKVLLVLLAVLLTALTVSGWLALQEEKRDTLQDINQRGTDISRFVAKALAFMPLPLGRRVSFLAPSGAMLVCLTDLCHRFLGLEVPELTPRSRRRLQEISPPYIRMRNPVDIWPAALTHGIESGYGEAIKTVVEDANIDAVVPILMLSEEVGMPDLNFLVGLAQKYPEKPMYVTFSGEKKLLEEAKAFLEPRGVPTFLLIEEPFEVLSILNRCRQAMERPE